MAANPQAPYEAIVVVPHPGQVVPGSVRDVYENQRPEPEPFDTSHLLTDEEHAAIAAELAARAQLPETDPELMQ